MDLKNIFNQEQTKKNEAISKHEANLKAEWDEHLKGANLVIETLSFLPKNRYFVKPRFFEFSMENCYNSWFPQVEITIGLTSLFITKSGDNKDDDEIILYSMGIGKNKNTFETLVQKIAKY